MQKEDRITYERDRTITQLFHGQRYGPKMCEFADVDAAEIAVYNRLGEYEDTGLSPEEIEELKYKHEKLRQQIASLEDQLQKALASAGKIKCEIHITVECMCECVDSRKDGEKKRRIPWEAD